jgi:DNA-binding SARP family transcriptional activator
VTDGLRLSLFGGFHLKDAEGQTISISLRKGEALLAYVATAPGLSATREKIATLLWGESDQHRARQSLRQVLFALTRALAEHDIRLMRMENQLVSLDAGAIRVDTAEFEALIASGTPDDLITATALYKGDFLADLSIDAPDFEDWLGASRRRFQDLALNAFVQLLDHHEQAGEIDRAIDVANRVLRVDPYREDIHRRLMRFYVAKGRRSSALAQYRACQAILRQELGVDPDDLTVELYRSIFDQAPSDKGGQIGFEEAPADEAPGRDLEPADGISETITVGRSDEIRSLRHGLAGVAQGRSQLVAVLGESGIGKSHMIDRFVADLADEGYAVLTVRARQAEQRLSLGLLLELLNRSARWNDGAAFDALGAAARDELARFKAGRQETGTDPGSAGTDQRALYDAAVELLRSLAQEQPLVVLFDDLQWADDESLRLLFYVVRHAPDAPILFVGAARTEDLDRRAMLRDILNDLERDEMLLRISLKPFSREETTEFTENLQRSLGLRLDQRLANRVWELSEGNPRMVLEAVLADAAKSRAGGGTETSGKLLTDASRLLLPLSERARTLAVVASVIGMRVDDAVLGEAADLGEEETMRGVEELAAAQILSAQGDGLVFARSRVRSVIYDSLMPARRRTLHAVVAQAIERVHAEVLARHYQSLASHYREAGRRFDALEYELRSALAEVNRGLPASAGRFFQRTIDAVEHMDGQREVRSLEVEARLGLAAVAEAERNLDSALDLLKHVEVLLDEIESAPQRAAALYALSRIHFMGGDTDAAYEYARRALKESARASGDAVWLPAERMLGRVHLTDGAYGRIVDHLVRRRQRCRSLDLRVDEADVAATLGLMHAAQGNFDMALRESDRAVQLAENVADERYLATCLQFLGMVQTWRGDAGAALASFEKATDMAEARGDLLRLYALTGHRGFALLVGESYTDAVFTLKQAVAMGERLGTRFFLPLFKGWLAEAAFESGRGEEALAVSREAFRLAAEANQPWARSVALRALARVLAHPEVRDLEGAEKAIRSAIAEQRSLGLKFEQARSLLAQAKIIRASGDVRRSSQIFLEASAMYRTLNMAEDSERARNMGEALRPVGESS